MTNFCKKTAINQKKKSEKIKGKMNKNFSKKKFEIFFKNLQKREKKIFTKM